MSDLPNLEEIRHHARRMGGRDPHQQHRAATPLELLFDLTFVLAFAQAASKFSHLIAEGHFKSGLLGFSFAAFAICWAWINFSWFASAYDTDDWIFRLVTMVQMVGVLIVAIGLPAMFLSIEKGDRLDNSVMVLGYVVMRVALVFQWLRAAKQDPSRRRTCLTYAAAISIAQIGWIAQIFLDFTVETSILIAVALIFVELLGPILAERKEGGTPWHAHHIVERYGLFAIIALGEGVVGTVAVMSAMVEKHGWTPEAAWVSIAGVGLTFGMWWVYYVLPSAPLLHRHRNRSFVWGYGQMITITSIVATGAGLHVAAYFIEREAHITAVQTVLAVAIPVGLFLLSIYGLYYYMGRRFDPFHLWLLLGTVIVVLASVSAAMAGVNMALCLLILTLAPAVTVVGYEVRGHRHSASILADDLAESQS